MSLQSLPHPPSEPGWLVLVRAVEQLAGSHELSGIIDIVRSNARNISGADGVCFVLRDGECCHYVDEDAVAPLWKGRRFPLSDCISGWAMLHDSTVVVPDIYLDPRIPHDAYRPTFVKSLVVVPVRTHAPVAAIGFYWGKIREFSADELALVEALGHSTSAAFAAIRAREEWRESEQRFALALEAGGMGAFEIDLTGGGLLATPALKAIFGRGAEEDFSREDMIESFAPDDRERAVKVLTLALGSSPGGEEEFRILFPHGERYAELRARLILDVDGRPARVAGVMRDVTERVQAKERHDALLSELLRASRLNDLGAMASALAHELNQPIAAGSNYLKAAERLLAQDPAKALDAIGKAGNQFVRTKDIIQRIRGFVGQGQSPKQQEDIEKLIAEVLELTHVTTRYEGVQVFRRIENGLPKLEIDKVQIQQVLFNLLRNAVEALDGQALRRVTIGAKRKEDAIVIRVADTGPGLSPEIAEHLFQPFHTTKEGGMGVGLTLCRKIVDNHGGKLWYEPPDISGHQGATFCVSLPVAKS